MIMNTVPVANRLHIALFGRRNVGKSSLINALTGQSLSVVSEVPGTTTDPVYKTMELLPIGPVVIIDTAGMDDIGDLGNLRVEKTYDILRKTNYAVIVINAQDGLTDMEKDFAKDIKARGIPAVCVVNKSDLKALGKDEMEGIKKQLDILCFVQAL
jgi:small GTP-binding protein